MSPDKWNSNNYEHINVGVVSQCDKVLPDKALEQSCNNIVEPPNWLLDSGFQSGNMGGLSNKITWLLKMIECYVCRVICLLVKMYCLIYLRSVEMSSVNILGCKVFA